MPRGKEIRITYEEGDQEGFCLPESVEMWEAHGWTRADDGSSGQAPGETPSTAPSVAVENQEG